MSDTDTLAPGLWRQAVKRALQGKRGQSLLRELVQALDEMDKKHLYAGRFITPLRPFCALGVLGAKRGTKMDDLIKDGDCDPAIVGERFGIARSMAAEIMYTNDSQPFDIHPADRWQHVRAWAVENIKTPVERRGDD